MKKKEDSTVKRVRRILKREGFRADQFVLYNPGFLEERYNAKVITVECLSNGRLVSTEAIGGNRVTLHLGMQYIFMTKLLYNLLTEDEVIAVIYHELGHMHFGSSEVMADIYAIKSGYGHHLSTALGKIYDKLWADMDEYQPQYLATPRERIAAVDTDEVSW